jgi:N6-L-threonylcarbamoyladenine synthase
LVGISFARALAYVLQKKIVGVHHIEAHLASPLLENPHMSFPFVSLVVSGGHTALFDARAIGKYRLLGQTIDDAVGEAYDKVAKLMQLGYPGGPILDRLAKQGNPRAISFPRGMLHSKNLDFSFSGLKTAVLYHLRGYDHLKNVPAADVAASFQEAVVDVLVAKMKKAAQQCGVKTISMAGGVACNSRLRERLKQLAEEEGWQFFYPSPILCTDNAAMIAALGYHKRAAAKKAPSSSLKLEAKPNWLLVNP